MHAMGAADEVATKQRNRFGCMDATRKGGEAAQLCPHMRWHIPRLKARVFVRGLYLGHAVL
jgi:hypothetical protein